MAHNKCQCSRKRNAEYLNLEYNTNVHERWLCETCKKYQSQINFQRKNQYQKQEDVIKILEADLKNFKINRQSLLLHLHKLFDQFPIQYNHKIQYAQEISQINALFIDIIKNPFNEQESIEFDDILKSTKDVDKFNQLTELEIKRFLSIGRGHYQCDNSKVEKILNIMMNIDDIKSSNLVIYLKLIVNQSEYKLCYNQKKNVNLLMVTSLSVTNNLLYYITFLNYGRLRYQIDQGGKSYYGIEDTCCIYARKNINNNPKNYFQFLLKFTPNRIIKSNSISCKFILIIQLQSYQKDYNKTHILMTKSRKLIRSFTSLYETIQYDQKSNQIMKTENLSLCFYNLSTLQLSNQIKVYEYLNQIYFEFTSQKVFSLIDQQLAVFDIDQQNKGLIYCQRLYYNEIVKYHINEQNKVILLLSKDKILILDYYFTQVKCVDWNPQGFYDIFTQVSDDMKYLYSQVSPRTTQLEIFKMSLAN